MAAVRGEAWSAAPPGRTAPHVDFSPWGCISLPPLVPGSEDPSRRWWARLHLTARNSVSLIPDPRCFFRVRASARNSASLSRRFPGQGGGATVQVHSTSSTRGAAQERFGAVQQGNPISDRKTTCSPMSSSRLAGPGQHSQA
ncbi:hypothetical protein NDU88_001883 [Pleurodeles waltl]|uniref:Uncharacterized protein n=1 Tax=Pleurodeles waltl TaxID=8319 RepID=A0AAV7LHB1_PLEWA|nr:hypothetical protein NDU88_001883 [Pleurodeles waltl]